MNNLNGNEKLYMNRIIKLISPITCQTFKIELNGEEEEMRELLGTILEINPKSIKGLRDSFNNYYTISSAVKNPLLNTDPYNYYTVVIKGNGQNNNLKYIKYPSLNLASRDQMSNSQINYEKNFENKTMNFLEEDDNYYTQNDMKYKTKDFLDFSTELYKRNYIDKILKKRLKKLIKENNQEVISLIKPYINSKRSYDELVKKIKPVISSSSEKSEKQNESKNNSSVNSSHSKNKKKHKHKHHKSNKESNNKNSKKDNNNLAKEEMILNDMKLHFQKEQFNKLKELIKKKDPGIIKSIKHFEKYNDYNHLVSKLNGLAMAYKDNSEEESNNEGSNEISEDSEEDSDSKKESSNYIKEDGKNNKKNKNDSKGENANLKNISKKICNLMLQVRIDYYYIAKYDLDKMKSEEKASLFKKKFKLNLDKINSDKNYKIPKKSIPLIEKYYTQYLNKKIIDDFNDDQKSMYNNLCTEDEQNNNIMEQIYKDFLKNKDLKELQNQIKKYIEEAEKNDIEEEEEDDDENRKSYIKEENENEGEEEEDYEGEEDEEGEGDENDDEQDKKDDSSSNNFILKNGDKDETAKVLNNNYKKNYHFSNFANNNNNAKSKDSVDKSEKEEKKNSEEENNNLGLNFVRIMPKKINKEEEKKDQDSYEANNKNNISIKENSVAASNANKKINAFISQIEHIKKIDEIKTTIIDAVHKNNKYIMELFEKFQKNKSILNKKSLYEVFTKIKENPDSTPVNQGGNSPKLQEFKALLQKISQLNEREKEFIFYDFANNENSKFIKAFETYKACNELEDFEETITMMMKSKTSKELFIKYWIKKLKESENDLFESSKEFINIMKENGFYNEKDCQIMDANLGTDDGLFLGIFKGLFDTLNFNDFTETMNLALKNRKKEGNLKNSKSKWDMEIIQKNYEKIKQNIDEKNRSILDQFYKKKNEKLYNILQSLNSTNLNQKIKDVGVLILKKELAKNVKENE